MKEILEEKFGPYYGSSKKVAVASRFEKGKFAVSDAIACMDCKVHTPDFEKDCDKVVAFLDSKDTEVQVIELETFLNEYNGLKAVPSGKKCDLLMYSSGKVVFCDMTCSSPKYIGRFVTGSGEEKIGKRLTVRGQIENSINLLRGVPELTSAIDSRQSKVALFAYREKVAEDMSDFDQKVTSGMNVFVRMQKMHSEEHLLSDMGNGFYFTEVKYPEVYQW